MPDARRHADGGLVTIHQAPGAARELAAVLAAFAAWIEQVTPRRPAWPSRWLPPEGRGPRCQGERRQGQRQAEAQVVAKADADAECRSPLGDDEIGDAADQQGVARRS